MTLDTPHVVIILALLAGAAVLGSQGVFTGTQVFSVFVGVMAAIGISVAGRAASHVFNVGAQAGRAQHAQQPDLSE